MANICAGVVLLQRNQFQLPVELGDSILGQEPEEIEAEDGVLILGGRDEGGEIVVVGLELGDVAFERGNVL